MPENKKRIVHNVAWSVYWKAVAIALLIILAYVSREALVALFFSLILSSAIEPLISSLQRKGVPRLLSVVLVYLVAIAFVGVFLYFAFPSIVIELSSFLANIDEIAPQLSVYLSPEAIESLRSSLFEYADALLQSGGSVFGFLSSILGGLIVLVATAVITFYILINENGVPRFIRTLSPETYEDYFIRLWLRVKHKLGRWLQAQLLLSVIIGIISFAAFKIIGLEYVVLLAIVAGMLEIVPVAGPIFAGALAILVGLSQSPHIALLALIAALLIQQFENHVLVPLLTGGMVGMNPVIVIVALMAGSAVGGVVGMVLAIPIVVVLMEIIEDRARQKKRAETAA